MWFPSGPSAGEVRNGRFLLKVYRLLGSRWNGRESEISWDEDALCPQNRQEPSSLPAVPRRLLTDVQPFSRFSTLVYKKLLILYLKFTYSWALFHLAPYRRPPAVAGGVGVGRRFLRRGASAGSDLCVRWDNSLEVAFCSAFLTDSHPNPSLERLQSSSRQRRAGAQVHPPLRAFFCASSLRRVGLELKEGNLGLLPLRSPESPQPKQPPLKE